MFNKRKTAKTDSSNNFDEHLNELTAESNDVSTSILPSKIMNIAQKPTIISEGALFEGQLVFDGTLHIDGKFKGTIKVDKITVGKNGVLDGTFQANTVVVFGEIKGEVLCEDLTLNSGSNVDGVIQYASIKIQQGSSIGGEVIHKKNSTKFP
ncbi:MAG: polymer-forming cytoskeletal protein [Methylophilaceae bacterium]|nr:MAG: polymer-forming cytoskeletal protein [Methylophilaceae bacterium]